MHSVGRVYITRSEWDEGLRGLPHPRRRLPPPKKDRLFGVPAIAGKSRGRSGYATHLIVRAIILPLSILRWVVSTIMGMGRRRQAL